jgi:hypothetical protein
MHVLGVGVSPFDLCPVTDGGEGATSPHRDCRRSVGDRCQYGTCCRGGVHLQPIAVAGNQRRRPGHSNTSPVGGWCRRESNWSGCETRRLQPDKDPATVSRSDVAPRTGRLTAVPHPQEAAHSCLKHGPAQYSRSPARARKYRTYRLHTNERGARRSRLDTRTATRLHNFK